MKNRCAIYCRVSTDKQDTDNQLLQLRSFCHRRGWTIENEFIEVESGASSAKSRKSLTAALKSAHQRKYDVLVVWALDRLTREGAAAALGYLENLQKVGVSFVSYQEPHLDTTGPLGDVLVSVYATFAKIERQRMSDRVKAGLERAKTRGKRIGKAPLDPEKKEQIIALNVNWGMGSKKIAQSTKFPLGTIRKVLTQYNKSQKKQIDAA